MNDSHITEVLGNMRRKGIVLWAENGKLNYRAPRGALSASEIQTIRGSKQYILELLESARREQVTEPRLEQRARRDCAPLTFPQLAYWNLFQLDVRPSTRCVASAMRIRGRLRADILASSVAYVIRRHEALRTRILIVDGTPMQKIEASGKGGLIIDDLTSLGDDEREAAVQKLIERDVLDPVDVANDELFAARLLKLHDDEHLLIVSTEHMISDGISMNILLRDMFAGYAQMLQGQAPSLPEIPMQFADYAVWQRKLEQSWDRDARARWQERLTSCPRLRFPPDLPAPYAGQCRMGCVPFELDRALEAELRQWCRKRSTTLVMTVFSAYAAFILRWCNAAETVILYQTDGRFSPEIRDTIGYFAFRLYVRVKLLEHDNLIELMSRVTEEYCAAYENRDFSYLEAQRPPPEFVRNTCFNWLTQDAVGQGLDLPESSGELSFSPVPLEKRILESIQMGGPDLDIEPRIGVLESQDGIRGGVVFPSNRYSVPLMEDWTQRFLEFLRWVLRNPGAPLADAPLR